MDDATRAWIYKAVAGTLCAVVIMLVGICVIIMWRDGNSPLVTIIGNNMWGMLVGIVTAMTAMVLSKDISNAIVSVKASPASNASMQANTVATQANTIATEAQIPPPV